MERHGGKINHETIADMHYLEAVIMENLRMHTPVLAHIRVCREDCEVKIPTIKAENHGLIPNTDQSHNHKAH